ncbi:MAG: hypothetical protein ACREIV_08715, partial [Planctomycetaceae bacterium]
MSPAKTLLLFIGFIALSAPAAMSASPPLEGGAGGGRTEDSTATTEEFFQIQIIDDQTSRGVPLVELRTVNGIRHYTDSNGLAAFREPGLRGRRVFFHVESHGYEFPKDGFGMRGRALMVTPGGSATLKIQRKNIAERLYRVTGGGIYRDSVLLGEAVPIEQPVLNGQVFGCDSVMNALYRGKLYWFWGDTTRPAYPLGNFHMTGARSLLPKNGGLDPAKGVNFDYFVGEEGFVRPMAEMPGEGPTWLGGLTILCDDSGRERMYAGYEKVRTSPSLKAYEHGLVVWNDEHERFE